MGLYYDQAKALRLEIAKERVEINREFGDMIMTLFYEPGTPDYNWILKFADGSKNRRAFMQLRKNALTYGIGPSWYSYEHYSESDHNWIPKSELGNKVYLLPYVYQILSFLLPGVIEKINQEVSRKSLNLRTKEDEILAIKATCLYLYKITKIILIYSSLWRVRHEKIMYLETIGRHWTDIVQETESPEAVEIIEKILEIIQQEESTIRESITEAKINYSNYIVDIGAGSIMTAISTFGGPVGVAISLIYSLAIGPIEQYYAEKRIERHKELITKMNELLTEYIEVYAPVTYENVLLASKNLESKWQEIRVSFDIDEFIRYIKQDLMLSVEPFRADYWNGIIDRVENLIIARVLTREIRKEDIEPDINEGDNGGDIEPDINKGRTGNSILSRNFMKYVLGGLAIGGILTEKSPDKIGSNGGLF